MGYGAHFCLKFWPTVIWKEPGWLVFWLWLLFSPGYPSG